MSDVRVKAILERAWFVPGERIIATLVVTNHTASVVLLKEPDSDSRSLTLRLRSPSGKTEVMRIGDKPRPQGSVIYDDSDVFRLIPGDYASREIDLRENLAITELGHYVLHIEYAFQEGQTWRSPELAFDLEHPSGTFMDVLAQEASENQVQDVIWVERTPHENRVLLFEADRKVMRFGNATDVVSLPIGAVPVLSILPPSIPYPDRWLAWIADGQLHLRFGPEPTPDTKHPYQAPPFKLPAAAINPRLVRPMLTENIPFTTARPGCTIAVLASSAAGGKALHLFEADGNGHVTARGVVPISDSTVGCWAIAPAPKERVFAFALAAPGQVFVFGTHARWGHACSTPARWFAIEGDRFLLGDMRATADGHVHMGVVVQRGASWELASFTAPASGKDAEILHRTSFTPPDGAEPVRARLDPSGAVHLLYRVDKELAYVPPDAKAATWTNDRLGALAPATAHLVLPQRGYPAIVAYDPDRGPAWEVLPRRTDR